MIETAIQWIEPAGSQAEAQACLDVMAAQDGWLGGWLLPASDITPQWRAQGFMDAAGVDPRGWLPDGLRFVQLPPSVQRRLAA